MFIYKITNIVNGKIYVGQTVKNIKYRWSSHSNPSSNCKAISSAIRKYGKENFTIEEIDGANSLSELNYLEKHYICLYNSLAPNGYNIRKGGGSGGRYCKDFTNPMQGKKHSYESKDKMRKSHLGKKLTQEVKDKMSKTQMKLRTNLGRRFSEEVRLKQAISSGSKSFKVYDLQMNLVGEWINQHKCGRDLELDQRNINACLKEQRKTHKGYIFRYV